MSNGKNLIIVVLAVGLLVSLGMWALAPKPIEKIVEKVGAVASPEIMSDWFGVGGVHVYKHNVALTQSASTTCAIQSPAATSSLLSAGIRFGVGSTTEDLVVSLGRGTNQYSTTTALGAAVVLAGTQDTIIASTTPTAAEATVFPPLTWFNVKIGPAGTGSVPEGACHATFESFE